MEKVLNYIKRTPISPLVLMLIFVVLGLGFFYIFRDAPYNAIEYFFTCFGIGLSATVVQCSLIQNMIQKDNIKIQLFDKRYKIYLSVIDSITIIRRNNWDRYILFNEETNVSKQILEIEENLYCSVQLSPCLFNRELVDKLTNINNAFCKVAESYKALLISNLELCSSEEGKQKFIDTYKLFLLSTQQEDTKGFEEQLKEQLPKMYINLMEFSNECERYLAFVEQTGIIKDFSHYIVVKDLD